MGVSGAARAEDTRARQALLSLLRAEAAMLNSCMRLQRAEQVLAERVRGRRRRSLRPALRQIEMERQRLGRDLHTGVGQMLAAIRLQAELIDARLRTADPPVAQALARIETLVQEASEQVRSVSSRMYPPAWHQASLEDSLRHLWSLSGIPERFQTEFDIASLSAEPELEIKILIYRAAQEGLSNIARHSRARRVSLRLECAQNMLTLRLQDDGLGFDAAVALPGSPHAAAGIGLRTIRDQARDLGGRMSIESGPHGTTLEVSVPLST